MTLAGLAGLEVVLLAAIAAWTTRLRAEVSSLRAELIRTQRLLNGASPGSGS